MVSRVGKFVGGFGADVTNTTNVHATENRVAFGHGDTNPVANIHVVGNAFISTDTVIGGDLKVGDDLKLTSDDAVLTFGAASEISLTHVEDTGLILKNADARNDKPVVLQLKSSEAILVADDVITSIEMAAGDIDGTDAATVAAGIHAIAEGTFAADANPTKLVFTTGVSESASASATAKMTLSSAGLLTIADDFIIKDAGTIGSASDPDAIAIGADGDVTLTQDLELQHDGATISFGTNDEIVLEHVHDTGLLLKDTGGSPTLQLHDSNESVSSDGSKLILTSNGVAFNLPTADGSAGQVLKTDGSRTLSFTDVTTDADPATSLASDTDCGALSGATSDTKDAFGIAVDDALTELDLKTQGANKLGTVDMGALS